MGPAEGSARETTAGAASGVSVERSRKKQAEAPESRVKDSEAVAEAGNGAGAEPTLGKLGSTTPDTAGEAKLYKGETPKLEYTGHLKLLSSRAVLECASHGLLASSSSCLPLPPPNLAVSRHQGRVLPPLWRS
ncbi:hypothetical protein CLOP_g3281 [Closterium sp. NIES-67]|nr:hypothetical protein CLOP_g3281 [Closterium sp. NIES-67]